DCLEGLFGGEAKRQSGRSQCSSTDRERGGVRIPRVIESRSAFHAKFENAPNRRDAAYDLETVLVARSDRTSGHEVSQLGRAVPPKKPCNQDVGVGPIELPARHVTVYRRDLEPAAFRIIQDRGEHTWAVKGWRTEPID